MDVGTPREIHLAFLSLIKLFKSIDMEQKSLTWNAQPVGLPSSLQAGDVQQVSCGSFFSSLALLPCSATLALVSSIYSASQLTPPGGMVAHAA